MLVDPLTELIENTKYYIKPYSLTKNQFEIKFHELFSDLTIEELTDNKLILRYDNRPYLHIISMEYINRLSETIPWKTFDLLNKIENGFIVTYFEICHVLKFKK